MLYEPKMHKTLAMTAEQEERLRQKLVAEQRQEEQLLHNSTSNVSRCRPPRRSGSSAPRSFRPPTRRDSMQCLATGAPLLTVPHDNQVRVPIYGDLGRPGVIKQLGFNADQQKRLKEIADRYRAEGESARKAMAGSEAETRAGGIPTETARDPTEIRAAARRAVQQTEALLTPAQLAALQDIQFRRESAHTLGDPAVEKKLGLSAAQQDALRRVFREIAAKANHDYRERVTNSPNILTPAQQEKLRAEIDRRGW